jgi:hypothetical protein
VFIFTTTKLFKKKKAKQKQILSMLKFHVFYALSVSTKFIYINNYNNHNNNNNIAFFQFFYNNNNNNILKNLI